MTTQPARRPRHSMPEFMKQAIVEAGLMERYEERPPYQRNDYIWWISSPRRDETKERRLAQMLDELKRGDVYMNMAWRPRDER